jgi:hypothetical protein
MTTHGRRAWVTIAVLAHLIVALFHGTAHSRLSVELSDWQQLYVFVVIMLMPLVALGLSFTRYIRTGLWLLLVSMLGSLIFGVSYHYVIMSPDHVTHLPSGEARSLFRVTALLLLVTETFGVAVAGIALRPASKRVHTSAR